MTTLSKQEQARLDDDMVVLLLQVPRTNDKKELAAEQMFASLHGLLLSPSQKMFRADHRVRISFEIAVQEKRIGFYVCVPEYLKNFVEEQIYAQYPNVQISEVTDFSQAATASTSMLGAELRLINNQALPIKTFQNFEVDPLAAITATLAKFEEGEEAWIQLVMRPAANNWHKKSERYVSNLRGGGSGSAPGAILKAMWAPPEAGKSQQAKLTEYDSARASGAEEKSHKLAFETSLRIIYRGNGSAHQASLRIQSIIAGYKQFNTTYLNGFEQAKVTSDISLLTMYRNRQMGSRTALLNIEEVATLCHLPHTNVETPFILWARAQTAEPPANLPIITEANRQEISPIAATNFRGQNMPFGLPRSDRGRHLYILGQTGVGKSGLLELLTISDIHSPYGFAVIDPHGDYALSTLRRIPAERAHDVVYFNPADTDFPIAFNPMEVTDPKLRTHTASELIGVLKRMFESWGPRLEYILRYSLLALLEYPDATMLDITRLLTDKPFRKDVMGYVTDPVVRQFWEVEFATWNDKFAAEAVAPVLNKVGAFTANPLVRNIIGQPKSSFNIRQIMDERKILIVNLSRGLVGEDNAALLGALLVTKVQLAAMSRADIVTEERIPFYLYVDEFQNFATDSFATILSEARKYALNLTVANQYIAQMSQDVRDAVFGNVGSMVAFRMGADDAGSMKKYFEPKFEEYDLVHMDNRNFVINMTIGGEKTPAFSATTLDLPQQNYDQTPAIVEHSRQQYAVTRAAAESYIHQRYDLEPKKQGSGSGQQSQKQQAQKHHAKPPVSAKAKAVAPPEPMDTQAPASSPSSPPQQHTPPPEVPSAETARQQVQPEAVADAAASSPTEKATTMGHTVVGPLVEIIRPKRRRRRRSKKNAEESAPQPKKPSEKPPSESEKPAEPEQHHQSHSLADVTESTEHTIFKR